MADYTIRVVLHGANRQDYDSLRTKLAAQGVVDYIKADNGQWYRLPDAEYTYTGPESASQVNDAVKHVAGSIRANPGVFVTTAGARSWSGLTQLKGPG